MSQAPKINLSPGPIALFGSGEISPRTRKVYEYIFQRLPKSPKVSLLETPAGFELNSRQVIGRVGDFLSHRFQNYDPQIEIVPARRRGSYYSPDNPEILTPLLDADLIFMGPGSPTYTVHQLQNSIAWQMLIAHHCLGGAIALASAATIAVSRYSLPVYEIYKVGEDLHWKKGLDLFGLYNMQLALIPHWNNNDGGDELDTSRCFMGEPRFNPLLNLLPEVITVIGIDELTGLIIEPASCECHVIGKGGVTILCSDKIDINASQVDTLVKDNASATHNYQDGDTFPLSEIGSINLFDPVTVLPSDVWNQMLQAKNNPGIEDEDSAPPKKVTDLVNKREKARLEKDWEASDYLREEIRELGWEISDTPNGPRLRKLK